MHQQAPGETAQQAAVQQQQQQPQGQQQQQQQQPPLSREQLTEQLLQRDAQIKVLQQKLEHYRAWLSSVQEQQLHRDAQLVKNARRLYIGGIPEGTREVRGCMVCRVPQG